MAHTVEYLGLRSWDGDQNIPFILIDGYRAPVLFMRRGHRADMAPAAKDRYVKSMLEVMTPDEIFQILAVYSKSEDISVWALRHAHIQIVME